VVKDLYRVLKDSGMVEVVGKDNIFPASPTNPNLATRNALRRAQEILGIKDADVRIYYDPVQVSQNVTSSLMKWSFRIFTFAGTEVRIHVTFFLLLLFVASQSFLSGQGMLAALESTLFISHHVRLRGAA
jgi:hypothetical protein